VGCWPANTAAVPSAISRVSEDYNSLLPKEPEELRDFAVGRCPLGWLLCEKGVRQKTDGENGNVEAAMVLQQPAQCATPMHIRSRFLATQFRKNFDVHMLNRVWSAYDGPALTWGLGQTLAMIGGGAQAVEVTQFRRFNPKMWDEDLKYNPSWGVRAAHGRKMVGSASFLPPTVRISEADLDKVGRHEYQVGWLALQASDFNHQSCTRRKARFPCSGPRDADAHALYEAYFSRLTHDTSALQQYMYMCATDAPSFRRPASLAFNARLLQLQVYNGGSHYLDWSLLKATENLTPERFFADSKHAPVTRQLSRVARVVKDFELHD